MKIGGTQYFIMWKKKVHNEHFVQSSEKPSVSSFLTN